MAISYKNINVGILGSGSFGTALANLVAKNTNCFMYVRNDKKLEKIEKTRINHNQTVDEKIILTGDVEKVLNECEVIIPVIPSSNFRAFIREISNLIQPNHTIIHGIKGLDISKASVDENDSRIILERSEVSTISEVIYEETIARKVGAISGPNLAIEISTGNPAGTVIASKFNSVKNVASKIFSNNRFMMFRSDDLIGVETAGTLKNIYAIASGIIHGLKLGSNARALLISRGMSEMSAIGDLFGANKLTFLGLAGVGDLVATCTSELSRNFRVGYWLSQGKQLPEILDELNEVAEGIKTVMIAKALGNKYHLPLPITTRIFDILFNDVPIEKSINQIMSFQNLSDIDFV